MRFLMKVVFDTDKANRLAEQGKMGSTIGAILEEQQPEAAYFVAERGQRSGFIVVNFDDPSDLPRFAEPWFLALDATLEVQPAMTIEDLAKAGPSIEAAVQRYGSNRS